MLKIINNLKPFFEDCYRRINVREYAKLIKVSPPTASKILTDYYKKDLLKKEEFRNYLFFYANKDNSIFIDLSRIYWRYRLQGFISQLEKKITNPTIVLFGSLAKAEVRKESDLDLVIFAHKKEINTKHIEKSLKRPCQLFWFKSISDVKNKELANNFINGYVLKGKI